MKLYLLKPRDDAPEDMESGGYEMFYGFVIRAKNETSARNIASKQAAVCLMRRDEWSDPGYTSCIEILKSGDEGIILDSFRSG